MGRYPDGALRAEGELPQLAPIAAAGAPADLLERRPDVLAAENAHARGRLPHPRSARGDAAAADAAPARAGSTRPRPRPTSTTASTWSPTWSPASPCRSSTAARCCAESRASVADRRAAAADYVRTSIAAWREVEGAISADQSLEVREARIRHRRRRSARSAGTGRARICPRRRHLVRTDRRLHPPHRRRARPHHRARRARLQPHRLSRRAGRRRTNRRHRRRQGSDADEQDGSQHDDETRRRRHAQRPLGAVRSASRCSPRRSS